ncbi:MAG: hypothetical protein JW941_13540 [Candidatus Coatesbacteria bacterium]|nr:hypothetical protein [Candidatus Coatesbacteria bacterium]
MKFSFLDWRLLRDASAPSDSKWATISIMAFLIAFMYVSSLPAALSLVYSGEARRMLRYEQPGLRALLKCAKWIGEHAPEEAIVMSEREPAVYLYSGRRAFSPSCFFAKDMFNEAARNGQLLIIQGVGVHATASSEAVAKVLDRTKGSWRVVHKEGSTYVIAQNGIEMKP